MDETIDIEPLAHVRCSDGERGDISELVFTGGYADPVAFRGIEDFSHLWIIWGTLATGWEQRGDALSLHPADNPNGLGMSLAELLEVCESDGREVLVRVRGAGLPSGTPVYDIKPYVPYTDTLPKGEGRDD